MEISNKFILIILIIIICYNIYLTNQIKNINKENFDIVLNTSSTPATPQTLYLDIQAIKNLSDMITKINAGNYTIPNNTSVNGSLTTNSLLVNTNEIITGNSTIGGIVKAGTDSTCINLGNSEIKMRSDGKAHYSIFNTDGNFSIRNTSATTTIGTLGTSLVNVDTLGNTTITGKIFTNGTQIVANNSGNWGMLWGDSCAIISKKGTVIRMGFADDTNAGGWSEKMTMDKDGNTTYWASFKIGGNLSLNQGSIIDLGSNDTTREVNAGKIGYGVFDGNALSIVGKGTTGSNRLVHIWDNVTINSKLSTNNLDPTDFPTGWGGGIRTFDIYAGTASGGTIATGSGGGIVNAYMNFAGDMYAKNSLKCDKDITGNNIISAGNITLGANAPATLSSTYRMHIYGDEYLYLLNKKGVIISRAWDDPKVPNIGAGNLTVEGNLNVGINQQINGQLQTNKICNKENYSIEFGSGNGVGIYMIYGTYKLILQSDRNLVLYENTTAIWSSGTYTSDRNCKKNIKKSNMNAINIINKLEVVNFQYLPEIEPDNKIRTGFIAQDVEPIIPDAVKFIKSIDGTTGNYIMYYEKIVPYLVKAMQEQQEIINKQQEIINKQQIQINKQQEQINYILSKI